jgi:hypothetical protein
MGKTDAILYPFHNANIHERRAAARFFRAFPLVACLLCISAVVYGAWKDEQLLLALCAVMNVALWLWITTTSLLGIAGSVLVSNELQDRESTAKSNASPFSTPRNPEDSDGVVHLIVFPNYKEDEDMMAETLASLAEAEDSHTFHVVLAMEAREGEDASGKGSRLTEKFAKDFAAITVSSHPTDLSQEHLDLSSDAEVPGKASNLKWAVNQYHDQLKKTDSNRVHNVILTVADADCMFHPEYFSAITKDFNELREKPESEHKWCMWQAPQLSYREHWRAPVCTRTWTYVSSMYEFGGVSGLHWGGHHMVFSGYSMPLHLAVSAESWDGDIIAEDHHAYLKTFFYSAHASAMDNMSRPNPSLWDDGCLPMLQVRPVFLPVKSTSVVSSEGYWATYLERWHQAKRHAQGIAELPYTMLVVWDLLWTLPLDQWSYHLFYKIGRILMRLFCMHILPFCQAIGLGVMTIYWLYFRKNIPSCPRSMRFVDSLESEYPLCAFGGAWTLVWPMAIPIVCVIVANYMMVNSSFIKPGINAHEKTLWHKEDSGMQPLYGSKSLSAILLIASDCIVFLSIMMIPYGLCANIYAMVYVCIFGNRFKYITASKALKEQNKIEGAYGTMSDPSEAPKADP